jgi:hypothetical protein
MTSSEIADVRARHLLVEEDRVGSYCPGCFGAAGQFPCDTLILLDEIERLTAALESAERQKSHLEMIHYH